MELLQQGAKPIFVDLDPVTWNMNIKHIENKYQKNKSYSSCTYLSFPS